jgi:hypothetical protein
MADLHKTVRELADVSGISLNVNRSYDWESIEGALMMSLPEDYKVMADSCPGGWFRLFAELMPPDSEKRLLGDYSFQVMDLVRELAWNDNYAGSGFPFLAFPERGGLLLCGYLRSPGNIFWKVNSSDPAKWTLVLTDEEFVHWEQFNGSLSGFLLEIATGRFDASGFSDGFRWEGQSHIDISSRPVFGWDTSCMSWPPGE